MARVTSRKARSREPRSFCMQALTSGARASGPGVSRRGCLDSIRASLASVPPAVPEGYPHVRIGAFTDGISGELVVAARTPYSEQSSRQCPTFACDLTNAETSTSKGLMFDPGAGVANGAGPGWE